MKRIPVLLTLVFSAATWSDAGVPRRPLRIFDFTPVSATANPVVARIDGEIEIPASELKRFLAAERATVTVSSLDLAGRRRLVEDLVDEYLLILEARRLGATRSPVFAQRMDYTRKMLLAEMLVAAEVGGRAGTGDEYAARLRKLRDDTFDACTIDVANDAHALLAATATEAARHMPGAGSAPMPQDPALEQLVERLATVTLATYDAQTLSAKKVLVCWLCLPAAERPDLRTQTGLTAVLKELLLPDLLAAAARHRGIQESADYLAKVDENESALLRMFMHDRLQREGTPLNPILAETDALAWFRTLPAAEQARLTAAGSPEATRSRILGDFLEAKVTEARARLVTRLRATHAITVDEGWLQTACE